MSGLKPVRGSAGEILGLLRAWDSTDDPEPLVIETSGSTGRPKRVRLSRDAMRASAEATHARLGGPGQWVLNLPPTYVAGVQLLFRSVVAGTDPVVHEGVTRWVLDAMIGPRRYLSLVPTQLVRAMADEEEVEALAAFDAVLVGGGPLARDKRAQAEAHGIRVVQTYGMSETCGGCVYDGYPLDGVGVKIDAQGEVLLSGPQLFDGYDGEPDRTAAVLDGGWFRTDDLGRLDDDGRLHVLGRSDDVAISGGLKVPLLAVAQMLESLSGVAAAAAVGVPDDEWGELVVAVVEGDADLESLRDAVSPRTWAPKRVVTVEALPRLANDKVDREAVRRIALDA